MFNVLFLCTGNSARSIMAEALLNHWGQGRFRAFSAGSQPAGEVNPKALAVLNDSGIPVPGAFSKSWDEFSGAEAVKMDFVITVCDRAKGETCPVWPGRPISAHWGMEDPVASANDQAFNEVLRGLASRVQLFIQLPLENLDRMKIQHELDEIPRHATETRN